MKCNLCGKEFEVGNREDGIPNGVSFMTKHGMLTVCADCIIDMGKEIEQADTPQTERMTEEEIDTMLAKVLVGQTDCPWK